MWNRVVCIFPQPHYYAHAQPGTSEGRPSRSLRIGAGKVSPLGMNSQLRKKSRLLGVRGECGGGASSDCSDPDKLGERRKKRSRGRQHSASTLLALEAPAESSATNCTVVSLSHQELEEALSKSKKKQSRKNSGGGASNKKIQNEPPVARMPLTSGPRKTKKTQIQNNQYLRSVVIGSERNDFIYHGQRREDIPRDVARVKVHSSIKKIPMETFKECSQLTNVDLPEGLEEIGEGAFWGCRSLCAIVIPPAVRKIPEEAFARCTEMSNVELPEGLEEIGEWAFCECTSLHAIVIPPAVRKIPEEAFASCTELMNVELPEGLEEIGERAFFECTSLNAIMIPRSVKAINMMAFNNCSQLTHAQFHEEIEDFVSGESMRDWWNHGVNKTSLSTYCFFAQCNVPERVGLVQARKWQANIHEMLWRIPSILHTDLSAYFDFIDSKLSVYQKLKDAPMLLQLAIYGNNAIHSTNIDDILNTDIIPHVLSYLTDG